MKTNVTVNFQPNNRNGPRRKLVARGEKDGWWTTLSFIPLCVLGSCLYVSDVASDIQLAIRYFEEGHVKWGICTVAFIVIPWAATLMSFIATAVAKFRKDELDMETVIMLIMALFNVAPIGILALAAWEFWKGDLTKANEKKSTSQLLQFNEILFESLPQLSLQLYIRFKICH